MNVKLRNDAETIVRGAIAAVCPDMAVKRALQNINFTGKLYLAAIGKAAWKMAEAALACLDYPLEKGIVITKYGHAEHPLDGIECFEAGHPVPDENTFLATEKVLEMTSGLKPEDTVLFLISGGGSALFEKPLVNFTEIQGITDRLLKCGADIREINTIRKRLSAVKGGRFARWCEPARIESVVLSDILGDPLDMIASGPAAADLSTCEDAHNIAVKYSLNLSPQALHLLSLETPGSLSNVHTQVIGSVRELCKAAALKASELGYTVTFLTDRLDTEARDAGKMLSSLVRSFYTDACSHPFVKHAFIAGGETVVHVTGNGLGGRNQEIALAASEGLSGLPAACVISAGSDGTDGPTDAAGGYADGDTVSELASKGISVSEALSSNDSYHALMASGGLIFTGPTGTNVNDISVALLQ